MRTLQERQVMWRNQYALECLVPMADRDYLCARACYRTGVIEQFLWSSLQAVEKYLKAILLLNHRSAKKLSHDIERGLQRVLGIMEVPFDIPQKVREFIKYLNSHAPNRYLERPYYTRGEELLDLDKAVWHIRRYCQYLRAVPQGLNKTEAEWIDINLRTIHQARFLKNPHKFRLFGGYLEDVMDGKHGKEARAVLIWKNLYWGRRPKRRIQILLHSQSAIPPHFRHADVFGFLETVVDFPSDVRRRAKEDSRNESTLNLPRRFWF